MHSQYIPTSLYARLEREWLAIKQQSHPSTLSNNHAIWQADSNPVATQLSAMTKQDGCPAD